MFILRQGPGAFLLLVFSLVLPSLVAAGIVNRTIDDSFGDSQTGEKVIYQPGGNVWQDQSCVGCAIVPNTANAFKGTYTSSTYNPGLISTNITMSFSGTAIYVFFILVNNAGDGITSLTEVNFTIDGTAPTLFTHTPDLTTTAIEFNQLAFSQTNLNNADHTLVISTSGVNTNVYVCFDYAIYTHVDEVQVPTTITTTTTTSAVVTSKPSTIATSASGSGASPGTTTGATSGNTSGTSSGNTSGTSSGGTSSTTSASTPGSTSGNISGNDVNASSTKSKTSTGAIAGGVIGGLAIIALMIFLIFYLRRRLDKKSVDPSTISPPMEQESYHRGTVVEPFILPTSTTTYGTYGSAQNQGYGLVPAGSASRSTMPLSPVTHSDNESAYGGYITSSQQASSGTNPTASNSDIPSYYQGQRPLMSVTSGDHISQPNNVEAVRFARQNELNQRLRTVQEEMRYLTSDLSSGEKSGRTHSIRRRTGATPARSEFSSDGAEEEMSMSDMREQLRAMREQIVYLQDQQRSAWAQGLSDDPPPGYSAARTSMRTPIAPPISRTPES